MCKNVDIYINNHLPMGDSIMHIEGVSQKMGDTSTYCNNFSLTCLMMKTAENSSKWESAHRMGERQYTRRRRG